MDTFGRTAGGIDVHRVCLAGGGLAADILTLGGTIQRLTLDGWPHPLTLGFDSVGDYERVRGHVGVVAGRYANRIAGGRFPLDGTLVQLATNEGPNTLHGGPDGFAYRVWQIAEVAPDRLRLELVSPAGDQGFPGRVEASVTYALAALATFEMTFEAVTDALTIVNLTQHTYFNLNAAPTIDDHELEVAATDYVPVDAAALPLGAPVPVAGTELDLTDRRRMAGLQVDHNYCLADGRRPAPVPAATLQVPGLTMSLATTEPGLQVYTGDKLQRGPVPRAGMCLEPQVWPDAPNRPAYPSALLRPGEIYRHRTTLTFRRS